MRARLTLALLIAAEIAALAVVTTRVPTPSPVDWGEPLRWLHRTDPETATLVIGRLLAIAVTGWLLVTTLVALSARVVLAAPLSRRCRRTAAWAAGTAPGTIRHLVEAAVAVGVVAATVAPAAAVVTPLAPVRTGRAPVAPVVPVVIPPSPTAPARPAVPAVPNVPTVPTSPGAAVHAAPAVPATPGAAVSRHRVVAGEHLWGIAVEVVRSQGRGGDPDVVDRYWRALCDANRDRLASGDPNVVLPGEELDLPLL